MPHRTTHLLICRWFLSPWCRCWGCCRGWGASPRPLGGRRLSGARLGSWWPGVAITATSEERKTFRWSKKNFTCRYTFLYKTDFWIDIHTLNFWISDEGIYDPSGWEFNWDWGWLRREVWDHWEREAEPGQEHQVSRAPGADMWSPHGASHCRRQQQHCHRMWHHLLSTIISSHLFFSLRNILACIFQFIWIYFRHRPDGETLIFRCFSGSQC